jgi:hypothetical protein
MRTSEVLCRSTDTFPRALCMSHGTDRIVKLQRLCFGPVNNKQKIRNYYRILGWYICYISLFCMLIIEDHFKTDDR